LSKHINSWNLDNAAISKLEKESPDAMKAFVKSFLESKDLSKLGVNRSDGTIRWLCETRYKDEVIDIKHSTLAASLHGKVESSVLATPNSECVSFWNGLDEEVDWDLFFDHVSRFIGLNSETSLLQEEKLKSFFGTKAKNRATISFPIFRAAAGVKDLTVLLASYVESKKLEPALPVKSPVKNENQSLIDFWGDSGDSLEWTVFYSLVLVVLNINHKTH
jgi:hypothetical protein